MGEGKRYRWEGEGKPEGVRGREMIQKTDGKGTRNRRDVEERKRYRRWMGRGWAAGERWRGGEIHKKAEGGGREVGEGRRGGGLPQREDQRHLIAPGERHLGETPPPTPAVYGFSSGRTSVAESPFLDATGALVFFRRCRTG